MVRGYMWILMVTCDLGLIYPAVHPDLSTICPVCPSILAYPSLCFSLADVTRLLSWLLLTTVSEVP